MCATTVLPVGDLLLTWSDGRARTPTMITVITGVLGVGAELLTDDEPASTPRLGCPYAFRRGRSGRGRHGRPWS